MMTMWGGYSTPDKFALAAEEGFERGDRLLHSNGGTVVEIVGDGAIARTKLPIMQRATVDGALCDVTCIGRDHDFVERRDGRWAPC